MSSNCSLGSVESTEDSVGDEALSLEPIGRKGRRCCAFLGGIVVMVLIVGFLSTSGYVRGSRRSRVEALAYLLIR